MLCLLIGDEGFALEAEQVEEVVPALPVRAIPGAPRGVIGVCRLRGEVLPVLDLNLLLAGRATRPCLSSRLVVVRVPSQLGRLGLLAEGVTETIAVLPKDFQESGVTSPTARFLGPLFRDFRGRLIQCLVPTKMFPQEVLDSLQWTESEVSG